MSIKASFFASSHVCVSFFSVLFFLYFFFHSSFFFFFFLAQKWKFKSVPFVLMV